MSLRQMTVDMYGCNGYTTMSTYDDTITWTILEILLEHIDGGGCGDSRVGVHDGRRTGISDYTRTYL